MNSLKTTIYKNLKNEGIDDIRIKDIIKEVEEYYNYLNDFNLERLDYIGFLRAIQYGKFLKVNDVYWKNANVWNDTKIYSDDGIVIWKPRNFKESETLGNQIWCVSYRDYRWNEHVNYNGETIYMIYNGWVDEYLQYTSACVERNGNIIIYDCKHNQLSGEEKKTFLKSLGKGLSVLKPTPKEKDRVPQNISVDNDGNYVSANDDGADYVSENNQYKYNRNNMKKRIRLTESDLHRIVNRSVKMTLNEIGDTTKGQYMLGRLYAKYKGENDEKAREIDKYASNRRKEQNNGYDNLPSYWGLGRCTNPMRHEFKDGVEEYCLTPGTPALGWIKHLDKLIAKSHLNGDESRWRLERELEDGALRR